MAESDDTTAPVGTWDLTGTQCPRTFVLAKVALERIAPGRMLEIVLLAGEQMQEVPRALKAEGHRVEQVLRDRDRYRLLVRRGGEAGGNGGPCCGPDARRRGCCGA